MEKTFSFVVRLDYFQRGDLEECALKDLIESSGELRKLKANPNAPDWEICALEKSAKRRSSTLEAVKDSFLHVIDIDALRLVLDAAGNEREHLDEVANHPNCDAHISVRKECDALGDAISKIESLLR